jgi:MFS family permease
MTPSTGVAEPRRWRVGTLVYTGGGLVVLFCWLLWGDVAWQLKERSVTPAVQIILHKFEASDFMTGLLILSMPAVIGILLGPVISYRSDRHRGRWGRRIPFLLAATPVAALAICGLAFAPAIGGWLHDRLGLQPATRNMTVVLAVGGCWTLFEFATVAANAVFNALINDVVPRELLGRFYGLFRALSLIVGMAFNFSLIGLVREHSLPILLVIGLAYGIGFALMCFRVKEGSYPPPDPPAAGNRPGFTGAIRSYVRECFTRPYYLWVIAWMALALLAFVPISLYGIYAAESFGLSAAGYGRYLGTAYACSFVLAYPLGWLADRFHAVRVGLAAQTAYGIAMAAGYFVVSGPRSYGFFYLAFAVLSGCYLTGAAAVGQLLFPRMKFAQLASAATLVTYLLNLLFGPALGLLLDHLGRDYRCTFAISSGLAFTSLATGLVVYRRFKALGGPTAYLPPD